MVALLMLMVITYLIYVLVADNWVVQTQLGQITVFQPCLIVLDLDVLVLVPAETGQSIHMEVTSKDNQDTCILDQHVTVGSTMDILQEHLI